MKASDLLALVKESSKGSKSVEGEVKTPSYDNMNTPDNHVAGKGTKEVTNAKKDFGKKRDKKNPANPGKPKKGEKRGMEGPGKSYKRMSEAAPGRPEGLPDAAQRHQQTLHHIAQSVQNLDMDKGVMVVAPDQITARAMKVSPGQPITIQMDPEDLKRIIQPGWQQMKRAQNAGDARKLWVVILQKLTQASGMKQTAARGRKDTAPNVYKGDTPTAPEWGLQDSIGESYADSNSMKEKQPVKNRGAVSKTAKVRSKVNDEPENKADPGKPKNDGKSVMGPGASPEKAKEVTEGLKDLEKLLGRKLNVKKRLGESTAFRPGQRVVIAGGSGIDSDKQGVIVDPREIKTDGRGVPTNVSNNPYKPVDWKRESAVRLDDGGLITMFNDRLMPVR